MSFWMCGECRKFVDYPAETCSCGCTEASDELLEMDMYEAWYYREVQKKEYWKSAAKSLMEKLRKSEEQE